jgi:hypothetical protein
MTETHTSDTFTTGFQDDDFDLHAQPVFVGLPVPGTEFGSATSTPRALQPLGVEGEIRVRSPSLLKGYWNKPEATAQALVDGWLRTGDIGVLDTQGFLHFLGRRKEMLKVKGMSVFPPEIEAVLGQHPAVLGSGVVGRPDADRGEVPVGLRRGQARGARHGRSRRTAGLVPRPHGRLQDARSATRRRPADDGHRQGQEAGPRRLAVGRHGPTHPARGPLQGQHRGRHPMGLDT